ncbi:MAG: glutamine-hydrolyzing carbamoyl-phosphate synthase small subunit [Alphaproteobacteria bacterium]
MPTLQDALPQPQAATAALILDDGSVFWGYGLGRVGEAVGEVCFNTSMTGYQEILTDPSYAGQIINFTFPHIGNVGTTPDDLESRNSVARGCIVKADPTDPSNYRSLKYFSGWLSEQGLTGISGLDTRAITRLIRDKGAPTGIVVHSTNGKIDLTSALQQAKDWPGLEGMDLAKAVTTKSTYTWNTGRWKPESGYGQILSPSKRVVAFDFGAKHNILRCLASTGCEVIVVPGTSTAEDVLEHDPDGVFLSNGPGDPAATGAYAAGVIKELIEANLPIFGICIGHQILAQALGGKTRKMRLGHRGGNHPVKDLETGKVEITSQNHGFEVDEDSLPSDIIVTHRSLFDGSNEGLRHKDRPIFSVQYHPEASPGPQDSMYLFEKFFASL